MRTGMDFRIKCIQCQRQVCYRPAFEKAVRKVIKRASC